MWQRNLKKHLIFEPKKRKFGHALYLLVGFDGWAEDLA